MGKIPTDEIIMNFSNDELAEAIDRAHTSSGDFGVIQKVWFDHLKKLLEIQIVRANTIIYKKGD